MTDIIIILGTTPLYLDVRKKWLDKINIDNGAVLVTF
jgi:hypothetical protein